jgi:hypothetical protein
MSSLRLCLSPVSSCVRPRCDCGGMLECVCVGLQPRPAHVGQGPLGLGLALCAYMYPGGSPSIINPIHRISLFYT